MKLDAKGLWFIVIAAFSSAFAQAQIPAPVGDEDIQSWNDVQLTVPMTEKFDFFIQTTARFTRNVSRFNEGRFGLGYVWKPNKSLSASPSYTYIKARNSAGRFSGEHRLGLRGTYKFPIRSFGLSHRSAFEYRLRRPLNSWRYRPSLTFEKDILKIIPETKVFVTEEVFYDSLLKKFSRNRFSVGINKTLTETLSVDIYYLRQNDGFSRPGDLNVIGMSWKIKIK